MVSKPKRRKTTDGGIPRVRQYLHDLWTEGRADFMFANLGDFITDKVWPKERLDALNRGESLIVWGWEVAPAMSRQEKAGFNLEAEYELTAKGQLVKL